MSEECATARARVDREEILNRISLRVIRCAISTCFDVLMSDNIEFVSDGSVHVGTARSFR
jgi:hypothetical protein